MISAYKAIFRLPGVLFCLLLLGTIPAFSQLNSANLTQYTEKDGLPGVQVRRIIKDRLGYLWFGTINGLARYDGYEFKRFFYDPNDSASIHGLTVWSLYEDRDGKIWVGSGPSFLNKYDPVFKTFRRYDFTQLVKHAANTEIGISTICEDHHGRIYFGVDTYFGDPIHADLLYKDPKEETIKRFPTPDGMQIQNVLKLEADKWGNIWCLSYSGMFRIDTTGKLTSIRPRVADSIFYKDGPTDFAFDRNGRMWLITVSGNLYDVNPETGEYHVWTSSLNATGERKYPAKVIAFDKDDNIWIGSDNGVQYFDRKTGQFSGFNNDTKNELAHAPVLTLTFDSFGTLWIGGFGDGLLKYEDKPQLKSYVFNNADKNSITKGWANCIIEASDGKIWMTTGGSGPSSGINVLDTRTGILQPIPFSSISSRINGAYSIWEHSPGEMYFSAFKEILSYAEKTHKVKSVKLAGDLDTVNINYYLKDSRGNEWLCTTTGLYGRERNATHFSKNDLSLVKGSDASSNEVTRAYESKKHGLWILTNNGLFLYNYNTGIIERHGFDQKEGDIFVTQDINSLYEDPEGVVWVGTWQGGLSKYNVETRKIKSYTRNDGLPSMSIQSILGDEKNTTLWLSTFEGLSRFDRNTGQFINFSIADGIQGQLFADGSCLKTSNGYFLFGGSNGITVFNPENIKINSAPPIVFLTDLKLFNQLVVPGEKSVLKKPIYETEELTLAHNQNNLSIEFMALHYSNSSRNKYTYKLENYDNEWRDVGDQHAAFYPNLPPGEYTFRVKAANDKGVWNEKGATLKILVNPPWWKTSWAYVLYAILLAALIYGMDRYLRRRLLEKERAKAHARELEQAREIGKAYSKLEETYEALKATQTQLIQSEKMASLGELTAGIAHEIQNPLNFVNNFSEINSELLDELQGEIRSGKTNGVMHILEDIRENEKKIIHHGRRADSIVKGMLQHTRTSAGQKELTDINNLADEYLRLSYQGLRAKDKTFHATIKTDFDESIQKVNLVPQDIARVLLNLYNNAFYAVKLLSQQAGGEIKGPSGKDEPTVWVTTKPIHDPSGAGGILISVRDNGPGISPKILDKIFQPFFTTKPTGQGTGLGLSLSYDIIKAHNGTIDVESKEGEGATFIVRLPGQDTGKAAGIF